HRGDDPPLDPGVAPPGGPAVRSGDRRPRGRRGRHPRGLPPPGSEPARRVTGVAVLSPSVVPGAGDLTLGSHAGQVLIGLTVHPARPGDDQLSFYLLPLEGSAATLDATLTIHGERVPLEPCGANCRRTTTVLQGHETVDVSIPAPRGGV